MTPVAQGLAGRISRAAFWSYFGGFSDRAIRFGVFVLLARLVSPAQFGTVVLAALVVDALQTLMSVGIGNVLVRETEVQDRQFDTTFWLNLGLSLCAMAAILVAAGPFAVAMRQPQVAPVLSALSVAPVLTALGSIHSVKIYRDLGFGVLAARTLIANVLASALSVWLALAGWGVWALVARTLAQSACQTLVLWVVRPWRPNLRFDWASVRPLAPAGLRLVGSNLVDQVNRRGFELIAGLTLGPVALGALRVAGQTIMLLIELTAGPLTAVTMTVLARTHEDQVLFQNAFKTLTRLSALVIFPAFLGLVAVSGVLLPLMFGAKWTVSGQLMPLLCLIALPIHVQLMLMAGLFATGRTDRMLQWQLLEAALTIVLALVGSRFGLFGIAVMGAARLYLLMPLGFRWLGREVQFPPRLLVQSTAPALVAALVMTGGVYAADALGAATLSPGPRLIVLMSVGLAVYAAFLPWTLGDLFARLRDWRKAR